MFVRGVARDERRADRLRTWQAALGQAESGTLSTAPDSAATVTLDADGAAAMTAPAEATARYVNGATGPAAEPGTAPTTQDRIETPPSSS